MPQMNEFRKSIKVYSLHSPIRAIRVIKKPDFEKTLNLGKARIDDISDSTIINKLSLAD